MMQGDKACSSVSRSAQPRPVQILQPGSDLLELGLLIALVAGSLSVQALVIAIASRLSPEHSLLCLVT
jgi:hypothetical protein